jgi:hypothetical protein
MNHKLLLPLLLGRLMLMLLHLRLRHHMQLVTVLLLRQALKLLHQLFCSEPFLSPR